ncbi:MAG: hypothetical protein R6X32_24255 [Chloroflexota bacterium]|jgi:hypothetical protein
MIHGWEWVIILLVGMGVCGVPLLIGGGIFAFLYNRSRNNG